MMQYGQFLSGERTLREIATGFIKLRPITLNMELGMTSNACVIYRGGWDLVNYVARIDGESNRLTVMRRGWFRSELLIVLSNEAVVFKCGNLFADALRPIFGSHIHVNEKE